MIGNGGASKGDSVRHFRSRVVLVVFGLGFAVWVALVAFSLIGARRDAVRGLDQLQQARNRGAAELADRTDALAAAKSSFLRAHRATDSAVLIPLRPLPVVGRQVRSFHALAGAAVLVADIGHESLGQIAQALDQPTAAGAGRLAMLERTAAVSEAALQRLDLIRLGPRKGLIPPLARARNDFGDELVQAVNGLRKATIASRAFHTVLTGPRRYLLLAANNAEMRAGSGTFLQAGEITTSDGRVQLGSLRQVSELQVPPDAVPLMGDHAALWGWLRPSEEWRNLGLTARFDTTAELAATMWEAAGQPRVDGVMALDPIALRSILAAIGSVEVDGRQITKDNVVGEILTRQYEGFLAPEFTQKERRDRLAGTANATFEALETRGPEASVLVQELAAAAGGRHVLLWSRDSTEQAVWRTLGVDGGLSADSVLLALINRGGARGGGKLDPLLDVHADLETIPDADGTDVSVRITVKNRVEPGQPTYVEGDPSGADVRFGVYEGILSATLPGSARGSRIDDKGLVAAGADGPNRVVAAHIQVAAGEERQWVVRFRLPPEIQSLQIEPSARVPVVRWSARGDHWDDRRARVVAVGKKRVAEPS